MSSLPTILLVPLLTAGVTFGGDVETRVELRPEERQRAAIETLVVESRATPRTIRVVGEIVRSPGATHPVRSLVEGRIERIDVAPGDSVTKGQPLLLMHSHTLHQLQAQLLEAIQELALAENRVEAGRQLLEIEGISRMEVDRREQEAFKVRLAVEAAKIELHDLGLSDLEIQALSTVDRTHPDTHPDLVVRAPIEGVVLELSISPQGWVQPWEPLMVIGDPDRLELQLQLTPAAASTVGPGDLVEFHPVGEPECACRATVVTRVPQVDPETRTVTIRAAIQTSSAQALPGVFVEGTLIGRERAATGFVVPEHAVTRLAAQGPTSEPEGSAGDHVFVELSEGVYEARPVTLGRFDAGGYEVISGLAEGDRIVVQGVFLLKSKLVRTEGQ